jgi:hypothetical protein
VNVHELVVIAALRARQLTTPISASGEAGNACGPGAHETLGRKSPDFAEKPEPKITGTEIFEG